MNDMPIRIVIELAMRKTRYMIRFPGDFSKVNSGDHSPVPATNITPSTIAKSVVIIADVLKTLLLSLSGKIVLLRNPDQALIG